jgi:hypothetical protein
MRDADTIMGEGERAEASSRRKRIAVLGALFAAGLFTGFYIGFTDAGTLLDADAKWSPGISLALLATFLIATIGGSYALRDHMDEVQRQNAYKAGCFAAAFYLVAYPTWFLLWKGDFVAEPHHGVMFIAFWLSLAGASLWYRFR